MIKVGIIGYGNMGQAIAEGIKNNYSVSVFDKDKNKKNTVEEITVVNNLFDLIKSVKIILLAVKPQDFNLLLNEIKPLVKDQLIISIAAGITTAYIEMILNEVKVIRAMPNIAVKILKAETGICKGSYADAKDLSLAKEIFNRIGEVWEVKEEMIDSVTAISGSGPAYIFYDMENKHIDPLNVSEGLKNEYIKKLNTAGIKVELTPQLAQELSASTTASAISLLAQSGKTPAQLRQMITSVGGTTEAAIKVISNGGSWSEAAVAAKKRAQELSKKE